MRVSTKRILAIGVSLVLFIGALLVYLNLIRGAMESVNKSRAAVASKTSLLKSQQQIVTQVQNLMQQFQNVGQLRSTISLAMPNGQDNIGALRQIEAIARSSNVLLTSVDFKASLARPARGTTASSTQNLTKRLGILKVTLNVAGPYESLKRYLSQLETSVRLANVESVKFSPAAAADQSSKMTVTVNMYYQE